MVARMDCSWSIRMAKERLARFESARGEGFLDSESIKPGHSILILPPAFPQSHSGLMASAVLGIGALIRLQASHPLWLPLALEPKAYFGHLGPLPCSTRDKAERPHQSGFMTIENKAVAPRK
jgi:hypothetical protein